MLRNLFNFRELIDKKRIMKVFKKDDLIVLGRKEPAAVGGYGPIGMEMSDFVKSVLSNVDASAFADLNTANMALTAFIDPLNGVNATGVVGDANKAYKNVSAGVAAGATRFVLMPGTYTETITLASGSKYYCMPGVLFTAGGLRTSGAITNTEWLGHAEFNGNFTMIYLLNTQLINCKIEFHSAVETGTSGRALLIQSSLGISSVDIKCSYIDCQGGGAYGIRFQGGFTGKIEVADYVSSYYGTIYLGITNAFEGDFTIRCPRIILKDGGSVGNNAAYKQGIYVFSALAGSKVRVEGDIVVETNATLASVSAGVVYTGVGNFYMNGNIYANTLRGLLFTTAGKMLINGNIDSGDNSIQQSAGELLIKNSTIIQSDSILLSGTAQFFMEKCTVYDKTDGNNIISHLVAGGTVYITDSRLEGTGAANCIDTGTNPYSAGLIDVVSNLPNDPSLASAYAAPGFTQEPSLVVPKIN